MAFHKGLIYTCDRCGIVDYVFSDTEENKTTFGLKPDGWQIIYLTDNNYDFCPKCASLCHQTFDNFMEYKLSLAESEAEAGATHE